MSFPSKASEPDPDLDHRYSRQILFAGIGREGQRSLSAGKIAVVGCGAIGCSTIAMLARAGAGSLRIIDRDYVEESNLQRQMLFDEADAAESVPKAFAAAKKIATFNSSINVEPHAADLVPQNIEELLDGMDLVLDATDNFETRYLINDFCVKTGRPWIYAAVVGSYAVTMNILPNRTACLRCIFPKAPEGMLETCDTSGVLNSAANMVASIQATEAIKILIGAEDRLSGELVSFDLWFNHRSAVSIRQRRDDCRTCGQKIFSHLLGEGRAQVTMCGRNSVQIHSVHKQISFSEMEMRLKQHGTVRHNDLVLKFWLDSFEVTLFPDGRAIVKGTTDPAVARSIYSRYIGP